MNHRITFPNLLQKRNLDDRLQELLETVGYIDPTMITVGENRIPWALYHSKRSGVKIHVAYTPSTGMPLQVEETGDRKHGPSLNHRDSILVEDRAYFKIQRMDSFLAMEQSFVIRMKENVEIVRPKQRHRVVF
ncbi:transposase [Salibacterium halotolerans]|uniref:Transposase DDE domain-containing protein n=1 Tax=Salibacterium halotolerans TaxID=1884432 RepID=A0A1I5Y3X7_9BACI|nr:transposase [Salibacterium halotolerans]SFQ38889.1 Transposase DDE domain-containing protein [Salibacterium halotolerans]